MFLLSEIVIPEKCNRMYNNKTSKVKRVSDQEMPQSQIADQPTAH